MKKHLGLSLILLISIFFLAWLWGEPTAAAPLDAEDPPMEQVDQTQTVGGTLDSAVTLRVSLGGEVTEMDLGTYLAGVLRAEMPASFETEALKAQAVAARTYTQYRLAQGERENHPDADVCDDATCCQAYRDAETAAEGWGDDAAAYEEKIQAAVGDTDGQCVLYEGQPVLAVFHAAAPGATQDAADVWSQSLPYLQSVQSPESEDTVPNYRTSATYTASELKTLLGRQDLTGSPANWFTNIRQNESGLVKSVTVGGKEMTGGELRTLLGLRSACFTLSFDGDNVTFSVTGYGHGVGMSQYGANLLAQDGMDYREILAWYYTGTTVEIYP